MVVCQIVNFPKMCKYYFFVCLLWGKSFEILPDFIYELYLKSSVAIMIFTCCILKINYVALLTLVF